MDSLYWRKFNVLKVYTWNFTNLLNSIIPQIFLLLSNTLAQEFKGSTKSPVIQLSQQPSSATSISGNSSKPSLTLPGFTKNKLDEFLAKDWSFGPPGVEYGEDTLEHLISKRIAETLIPLSLISMFITFAAFLVCICCPTCILNRLRQRRLRKGYKPKPLVVKVIPNPVPPVEASFTSTTSGPGTSQRRCSSLSSSSGRRKISASERPPTIQEITVNMEAVPADEEVENVNTETSYLKTSTIIGIENAGNFNYQQLKETDVSDDGSSQDPPPPYPADQTPTLPLEEVDLNDHYVSQATVAVEEEDFHDCSDNNQDEDSTSGGVDDDVESEKDSEKESYEIEDGHKSMDESFPLLKKHKEYEQEQESD